MGLQIISKEKLLFVFGGLPGTGKTTVSQELSVRLNAVYLRVDTIEQALIRENCLRSGCEGYLVAYGVAEENLRMGNIVVSDSVNPIDVTREAWRDVAKRAAARIFEIEIICSDQKEHRRRVEERKADIAGHKMPTWDEVVNREYHFWETKNLTIDTAKLSTADAVDEILKLRT